MTPYYADDWLTVYAGDCRDVLPTLAADSVDCIVTSPPYWGLRDYGTATWSGGDADCDHKQNNYDRGVLTTQEDGAPNKMSAATAEKRRTPYLHLCGKCGATRQDAQLGLEATPELYVANLVAVFRELRRVLKPGGTCWLNLGDSLNGKQLVGIPWRVAFALQADGWYLRSDIIWSKPNPMPESVTDRPTKAHEYLFLLTKNARYYYDAPAVREAVDWITPEGRFGRNLRSVWTIATRPYPGAHFAVFPPELPERCIKAGSPDGGVVLDPFAGSGTVGLVANRLSRRAILIDLNPEYVTQQMRRNAQTPLGLPA